MERASKPKLSFKHPGSDYSSHWERAHETLTNLNEIVADLAYLYEELDAECDRIPSTCYSARYIAHSELNLIYTAIGSLQKFVNRRQDFLNESIASAVKYYGQTAPEWY